MVDDPADVYARAKAAQAERLAIRAADESRAATLPGLAERRLNEIASHLSSRLPPQLSADYKIGPGGLQEKGIKSLSIRLIEANKELGHGFITVTSESKVFRQYSSSKRAAGGVEPSFVLAVVNFSDLNDETAIELLNAMIDCMLKD